ncbi:MAG TPA: serine hydrolase [Candidatus Acidoferrales bacterium]|nr:serine hydrolase [Candidatus Acidoferrales bacterium]
MIGLLLVAIPGIPMPSPIFTPTTSPISERSVLESGLDDAVARAKALGGTLGVTIVDLSTGASAQRNGDANMPMAGVQHLPIALLVYRAIEAGRLSMTRDTHGLLSRMIDNDDSEAANLLLERLGGSEAANAQLRALGYPAIFLVPNDAGYASSSALVQLLADLVQGKLLDAKSTADLESMFVGVANAANRLRAGLGAKVTFAHVSGTLGGADDRNIATNDAGVASVNGRTVVIVALLEGAHGPTAKRDGLFASIGALAATATSANP